MNTLQLTNAIQQEMKYYSFFKINRITWHFYPAINVNTTYVDKDGNVVNYQFPQVGYKCLPDTYMGDGNQGTESQFANWQDALSHGIRMVNPRAPFHPSYVPVLTVDAGDGAGHYNHTRQRMTWMRTAEADVANRFGSVVVAAKYPDNASITGEFSGQSYNLQMSVSVSFKGRST